MIDFQVQEIEPRAVLEESNTGQNILRRQALVVAVIFVVGILPPCEDLINVAHPGDLQRLNILPARGPYRNEKAYQLLHVRQYKRGVTVCQRQRLLVDLSVDT